MFHVCGTVTVSQPASGYAGRNQPARTPTRRRSTANRLGPDEPWADCVDAYPVASVVEREAARQAEEPGLRGRVREHPLCRQERVDGGDVDDRAATVRTHGRQRMLRAEPCALQVDGEDP